MVCPSRGANLRARRSATLQRPGMGFLSNLRTTAFDLDTALPDPDAYLRCASRLSRKLALCHTTKSAATDRSTITKAYVRIRGRCWPSSQLGLNDRRQGCGQKVL